MGLLTKDPGGHRIVTQGNLPTASLNLHGRHTALYSTTAVEATMLCFSKYKNKYLLIFIFKNNSYMSYSISFYFNISGYGDQYIVLKRLPTWRWILYDCIIFQSLKKILCIKRSLSDVGESTLGLLLHKLKTDTSEHGCIGRKWSLFSWRLALYLPSSLHLLLFLRLSSSTLLTFHLFHLSFTFTTSLVLNVNLYMSLFISS